MDPFHRQDFLRRCAALSGVGGGRGFSEDFYYGGEFKAVHIHGYGTSDGRF